MLGSVKKLPWKIILTPVFSSAVWIRLSLHSVGVFYPEPALHHAFTMLETWGLMGGSVHSVVDAQTNRCGVSAVIKVCMGHCVLASESPKDVGEGSA